MEAIQEEQLFRALTFQENDVVFGGTKRLTELIEATLKILKADLFVVLNGCIGELVGDDTGAVVEEFQKQGVPVNAETGGLRAMILSVMK